MSDPGSHGFCIYLAHFRFDRSIADHTHFPYMAPELLKVVMEDNHRPGGPLPVHPTSEMDMWSAGVCLYTMLCGYNPFAVGGSLLVLEGIQKGEFSFEEGAVSQPAQDLVRGLMVRAHPCAPVCLCIARWGLSACTQ